MLQYKHVRATPADPAGRGSPSSRHCVGRGTWRLRGRGRPRGHRSRASELGSRSTSRGSRAARRPGHGGPGASGGSARGARAAARPPRMIVLDTTVLVYARGTEHPLRDPCRAVFDGVERGQLRATTTPEVVQEFVHVRARRRGRADAVLLGGAFATLLAPLLEVTADDLRRGLILYERSERLGAFDAVLGATAIGHGATALVSADPAFAELKGIDHVVPDGHAAARLRAGELKA